ncbi:MAG: BREX system Lon protease-like protein BrxL [Alphaproteobacteria bacterium]|nr:BREX system Lon protease-like protein BrxL [Alphaproteobacteria bacterium]
MTDFDKKICSAFSGVVVRKDLVKEVKGNAIVPTYVLEYLLGQYCATSDEASIQSGIESVKNILREHYVHRNEAGLVRSTIKEKGHHKVIDKISVSLNDRADVYEATFSNLGISKVLVPPETLKKHPKLLVNGIWCIASLEYMPSENTNQCPWVLESLKPIQLSHFDRDLFLSARKQFTTTEWIDLLIQSMGFNPEQFGERNKLFQLMRLVPYCERNYNLIELGPKGTGKSHIYSEFSPHGILLSGGEVTVPKLFVNNTSGKLGLVGYWDAIAFDEFAGKEKKPDKSLVDIMKNYMANKSFSRGVETLSAEASMVFVGNTKHNVPHMLRNSDLFDELPKAFHDSAFLDRIHFYIPGWEVDIIRAEMFSSGYGFVVDYLAEILRAFRDDDRSVDYKKFFSLDSSISTRDLDGIQKTMSGLMKMIFPNHDATEDDVHKLLDFAIEGRKRVKDQIMRFDTTYSKPRFQYTDSKSETYKVKTLEETEYPQYYFVHENEEPSERSEMSFPENSATSKSNMSLISEQSRMIDLPEGNFSYQENCKGITFARLLVPYLREAKNIVITDPYLRNYWQIRNLMELMQDLIESKEADAEINMHVVTMNDEFNFSKQTEFLDQIVNAVMPAGINLTYCFDQTIHDRDISADNGWKIILGRGLDIFQNYDGNNSFSLQNTLQAYRACKSFGITYLRIPVKQCPHEILT